MQTENSEEEMGGGFGVKFTDPDFVVKQLDVQAGMKIADFGCGTGYFSLALAKKVGEEGVVYSLDILPQRLESVLSNAKRANLTNIIAKRVNLENPNGSRLEANSIDLAVLKGMLFQNKKKKDILAEAARVLKPGGQALVIEWGMANAAMGPEMQLRISKEALLGIAQQVGLSAAKEVNVGNFHYGVVLVK
ncbi:MAG: methyltransferase domain-containing protein [Parcubacteria group bacterium]|jgi:ubiquinone/menaquinone biosynthesis C-methylase UbiE